MENLENVELWFYKALKRPPETRRQFLDTELKGEPDILKSVLQLLEYEQKDKSLFTRLIDQITTEKETDFIPELEKYNILREISRGGMSVVYLAERTDGLYDQQVAVKILKSHMISEEILQNFHQEKNALASLQHAHIARIFDAGIASDGRPYFVMEYIRGKLLPDHLDFYDLSVGDRLRMFLKVCEAVRFAHQHLIIHGDIKPNNVMVNDEGEVKLTDFGIAQLPGDKEPQNQGGRLLTPEYASPEQVNGEHLDVRSDLFQLGKVLHDILPENIHASLKAITAKATHQEKEERYQSVDQLMEDVSSFLNHKPVSARNNTTFHLLTLFLQRNRWKTSLIAVVMTLFLIVTAFYIRNINEARQLAEKKEIKATETLDFMLSLFEQNDPTVNLGDTINIGMFLDAGLFRSSQIKDHDTKATVLKTLGEIQLSLGNYPLADSLLQTALLIYESIGDSRGVSETLLDLASLERQKNNFSLSLQNLEKAFILSESDTDKLQIYSLLSEHYDLSRPDTAITIKKRALRLIERSTDIPEEEELVYQYRLTNIGFPQLKKNETDSVIRLKKNLIEKMEQNFRKNLSEIALMYGDLAEVYSNDNRYDSSLLYARKNLGMLAKIYGPGNINVTSGLQAMARTHGWNGSFDSAAHYAKRSLLIKQKWFGKIHPSQLPERSLLAQLQLNANQFKEGEEALRLNYQLSKKHFGSQHKMTGDILFELLQQLNRVNKFDESITLYPELIRNDSLTYGMSSNTAASLVDFGQALNKVGRTKEALRQFEKALSIYRKHEGRESFLYGMTLFSMAKVHIPEKPGLALNFMDTAIQLIEQNMPENHPRIGNYQQQYASLLADMGKYRQSNQQYLKAIENYRINYSEKSPKRVAKFQQSYAASLRQQGLYDSARSVAHKAELVMKETQQFNTQK